MPANTTDDPNAIERPLTDPEALFARETISAEHIVREQDESHFETRQTVSGFVIVGVTNDDGEVLLTSSSDGDWWRLPYARVEPGECYVSAASSPEDGRLCVDVDVERVVHVRRFDALLEGSPAAELATETEDSERLATREGYTETHDVLLEATVDAHISNSMVRVDDESETVVEWFGTTPDGAPGGLPGSDLRRFIE